MPERLGQWDLLGHGSDPVIADTAAIDDRVEHYRKLADEMQVNAQRLDRIADGSALKGQYADELRSTSGEVARDLHKVVGRYQAVATALAAFEPEVEHALTESQGALDDAVAANGVAQASAAMPTQTPADGQQLTPDQVAQNDEKTARTNQAASALDAAKARLAKALGALDAAGQAAATTIRGGFDDGLKDSGWDRFVHGFMKFLKILVKVLTYIAMALAVIALVIPGVGEAVFAAGMVLAAIDVGANAALVAAGEGSWLDFGIALAGLVTFGVGKAFGPAIDAALKPLTDGVKTGFSAASSSIRNGIGGIRGARPAVSVGDDASSVGSSVSGSVRGSVDDSASSVGSVRGSIDDGASTGSGVRPVDVDVPAPVHGPSPTVGDTGIRAPGRVPDDAVPTTNHPDLGPENNDRILDSFTTPDGTTYTRVSDFVGYKGVNGERSDLYQQGVRFDQSEGAVNGNADVNWKGFYLGDRNDDMIQGYAEHFDDAGQALRGDVLQYRHGGETVVVTPPRPIVDGADEITAVRGMTGQGADSQPFLDQLGLDGYVFRNPLVEGGVEYVIPWTNINRGPASVVGSQVPRPTFGHRWVPAPVPVG
jgi:hypothetical protein